MSALPKFREEAMPAPIRGYSLSVARAADVVEVRTVVGRLKYEHMDPMGKPSQIHTTRTVRLDRQPDVGTGPSRAVNLQVQVNRGAGVEAGAGTTIGQVLVPERVFLHAHGSHEHNVRRHLERIVRGALVKSVTSGGRWFTIVTD